MDLNGAFDIPAAAQSRSRRGQGAVGARLRRSCGGVRFAVKRPKYGRGALEVRWAAYVRIEGGWYMRGGGRAELVRGPPVALVGPVSLCGARLGSQLALNYGETDSALGQLAGVTAS